MHNTSTKHQPNNKRVSKGVKKGVKATARRYLTLAITVVIVAATIAGTSYMLASRYSASHVKFVSINDQMYYTSDFADYMAVKLGDISPAVMNSTSAFKFYLNDFIHYKLIYQEAQKDSEVVHLVVENEVRTALERNASKQDVYRILSEPQVFNSFLGLLHEDSIIHNYIKDNFYNKVSVSPKEISQEYDNMKQGFDSYPIRHILGIITDNNSLQQEILEELKEYDFHEVAKRYDEGYNSVYLQEGFLTPDAIPTPLQRLGSLNTKETHQYDQGGTHHIYQVLGVYNSRRDFIPLDLIRDEIGRMLYHRKINSYLDDYIEILYTTSDIQYYLPEGAVVYSVINP